MNQESLVGSRLCGNFLQSSVFQFLVNEDGEEGGRMIRHNYKGF